jgi:hypothetical protein
MWALSKVKWDMPVIQVEGWELADLTPYKVDVENISEIPSDRIDKQKMIWL